jgi:plastocyanin
MHRTRALAAILCLAGLATCGGGGGGDVTAPPLPPPTPPSTSSSITVADNSYTPNATVLPVGTTVTWTWTGAAPHDVLFDDGTKSLTQQTGTYARRFTASGTYNYHCTVHGTGMSGKVTIQ